MSIHNRKFKMPLWSICMLLLLFSIFVPQNSLIAQTSAIQDKYAQLGGPQGFLGQPTSNEETPPDGQGRYQYFEGGSIYWHPNTGAYEVHGAIWNKWAELGWEQGFLGYPLTDELATPDGTGRYNQFEGGSIYWHPDTGAHEVHGAIWNKWAELGWEQGFLGYPLTDELATPDGIGRYNEFEGGSIYWHPDTGAHEVHGAILGKWAELGWEQGFLGYPLTDERIAEYGDGRWSAFQGGIVYWHPQTGAQVMRSEGKMLSAPGYFYVPGIPAPTATPCGNPCIGVLIIPIKQSVKVIEPEMILCSDAKTHRCSVENSDNQLQIFQPGAGICVIWQESGRNGIAGRLVVSSEQSAIWQQNIESYGDGACRVKQVDISASGNYQTIIRYGNFSQTIDWGIATPIPTQQPTATPTPIPTQQPTAIPTSTPTSIPQQPTVSSSSPYDTIMAKVRASNVTNSYPHEAELFVWNLVNLATSTDLGIALQQSDTGDRINSVVHRVWDDWKRYGVDHMTADPGQNGQSPFRQLVIRLIQGHQSSLSSIDQKALYSFFTRSEDSDTWRNNAKGVIGAINREFYGQ